MWEGGWGTGENKATARVLTFSLPLKNSSPPPPSMPSSSSPFFQRLAARRKAATAATPAEADTPTMAARDHGAPAPPPEPAAAAPAFPPAPLPAHRELKVTRLGSLVFVTPVGPDGSTPTGPSLSVELGHGAVGLADMSGLAGGAGSATVGAASASPPPALLGRGPPLTAWAVLGAARTPAGLALALVTRAAVVGTLRGSPVYRVTGTAVLPPPGLDADSGRYVRLLRRALDPRGAGGCLYFSHGADLTRSTQAALEGGTASTPQHLHASADPRFFWNAALAAPLLKSEIGAHPGLAAFVVPFIQGFFEQVGPLTLTGGADPALPDTATVITLIARRAPARAGVRHWRRGADGAGAVANFVETEQVVEACPAWGGKEGKEVGPAPALTPGAWPPSPHTALSATVTVRGSIPLLWSQAPDMKYKPRTRVGPPSRADPAFAAHFDALAAAYGGAGGGARLLALNLVNGHGSEGALADAYAAAAVRYGGVVDAGDKAAAAAPASPPTAPLRLIPFDFHAQCGATRYDRLDGLWAAIEGDVAGIGALFLPAPDGASPGGAATSQAGVIRINCVDCLDRTNVVQGWLARRSLGAALAAARGGDPGAPLEALNPAAEAAFKHLWADHGDALSRQYAGTGALKSGFTRTGKRGLAGLVDDGIKSLARYYLNNFRDGAKQDALDLATGCFVPPPGGGGGPGRPSPFSPQASPALPLLAALVAAAVGLSNAKAAVCGGGGGGKQGRVGGGAVATAAALSAGALVQSVALPLAAAAGIVWLVFRNGKKFVNRPQLLPEAAAPW